MKDIKILKISNKKTNIRKNKFPLFHYLILKVLYNEILPLDSFVSFNALAFVINNSTRASNRQKCS